VVLIQKNAEKPAMMGNFRPIGLLEVLRKIIRVAQMIKRALKLAPPTHMLSSMGRWED
jgi:hypothetical protein